MIRFSIAFTAVGIFLHACGWAEALWGNPHLAPGLIAASVVQVAVGGLLLAIAMHGKRLHDSLDLPPLPFPPEKQKALENAGWKFGDAADFLEMSDEERKKLDETVDSTY